MSEFDVQAEIDQHRRTAFREIPGSQPNTPFKEFKDDEQPKKKHGFFGGPKKQEQPQVKPAPVQQAQTLKLPKAVAKYGGKSTEVPFLRVQEFMNKAFELGISLDSITFEEPKNEQKKDLLSDFPA